MPKTEIDLPLRVEHLSILNERGEVDSDLEPKLDDEFLLKLYRAMLLARRFDERMLILQRQGKIGTFAPIRGQEAQIGAAAALTADDWLVPSFRETAAEIWRGKSLESVLLMYGGWNEGGAVPEGLNDLPVSIPVGTQTLHAVGIAYAMKYRKEKNVAMVFFGDGGTSEGDFHEALNFASVFQTPTLFVCQNNHWAISVPRKRQTRSRTIAQKALAYEMPGISVDGNDVLAVYAAAKEAADRAREGGGPTLIELVTYRVSMHTTADDPKKYRDEEEVAVWLERDPITRFEKYLTAKGLLDEAKVAETAESVKVEIEAAEKRWEEMVKGFDDPLVMFDHTFEELTPTLAGQRDELKRELAEPPVSGD